MWQYYEYSVGVWKEINTHTHSFLSAIFLTLTFLLYFCVYTFHLFGIVYLFFCCSINFNNISPAETKYTNGVRIWINLKIFISLPFVV